MAENKAHDTRISVAKAICIILMVVGHSGCPGVLRDAIYLFHMPCFFLLSGFFFSEKNLDHPWQFVKRRFASLWWPFVKFSLFFLILHNFMAYMYLCDDFYTWKEMFFRLGRICCMTGCDRLLGGFWFLRELFIVSLIVLATMSLLRRLCGESFGLQVCAIVCFAFLVLAYVLSTSVIRIPLIGSQTMLAASFYVAGNCYRKSDSSHSNNLFAGGMSLALVLVISLFFQGSMSVKFSHLFPYFIAALLGSYATLNLAGSFTGHAQQVLDYIGSKTLYILTFHFISFKLISIVKVWHYDLPVERLSAFPVISQHNTWYWVLYALAGVVIPLILWELVACIQHQFTKITNATKHANLPA